MTTHLAGQERTCRRAPAAAEDQEGPEGARADFAVSILRRPHPESGGLSRSDAAWPGRLRRIIRAQLTYWRQPDLCDTAALLLTELATNALRHAQGSVIGVHISLQGAHCVIEVSDGSPVRPVLRCADSDDENGRGLFLVEALADAWGVSADGTTTWCQLPLSEGAAGPAPGPAS